MKLTITLPWPVSVNRQWRSYGSRVVLSRELQRWRKVAAMALGAQKIERFEAKRLKVTMLAFPPDKRRRDIDNLAKGVLDLLQKCDVFEDDSQIDDLRVIRKEKLKGGKVEITIEEA